jgi:integrase
VFATGGMGSKDNARKRVLGKAMERPNARRAERDVTPLPAGLTPHSLRRTFASILFACGEDAPYVMSQRGHGDAKFTLNVYAQVMRRDDGEIARLQAFVMAKRVESCETLTRHTGW